MFPVPSEKVTNPESLKEEFQTKQMRKICGRTQQSFSAQQSLLPLSLSCRCLVSVPSVGIFNLK